jgi:hypothetical protein
MVAQALYRGGSPTWSKGERRGGTRGQEQGRRRAARAGATRGAGSTDSRGALACEPSSGGSAASGDTLRLGARAAVRRGQARCDAVARLAESVIVPLFGRVKLQKVE